MTTISKRPAALLVVFVCIIQVTINLLLYSPSCSFNWNNVVEWAPPLSRSVGNVVHTPWKTPHASTNEGSKRADKTPMLEQFYDVCVVGAGLSGSVIAERYANLRKAKVLIIERRDHIAGNCFDCIDKDTGIRVSRYGAHLFHTYYSRVVSYVQQFSEWTHYEHEVQALIDGKHVPVPVGIDTVNALFHLNISSSQEMDQWLKQEQVHYDHEPANSEEMALSRVGPRLYQLIFHPYTIKQWDKEPKDLGPEVTARIPVRNDRDPRYFSDPFQALPTNGYTKMFENMLENPLITVVLNTDFFEVRSKLNCGKMYYTGHIDRYFADLGWKKLEYRSLDFERKVLKNVKGYFQPKGVINHPNASVPYTRIVEYKHFLDQQSDHTILFYEYSKDSGEPYYPVPNPENKLLYAKYQDMADKEAGVSFVGRLANYKYFNMDQSIENALSLFDKETLNTDLIVHYCDQDTSWLKEWQTAKQFSKIFMYHTCGKSPNVDEKQLNVTVAIAELPKVDANNNGAVWIHHMTRKDIQLAGQNIFVQGQPKTTLEQLLDIMEGIRHSPTPVQFADLSRHTTKTGSRKCWTMNVVCAGDRSLEELCNFHQTYASTGRSCATAIPTIGGEFYATAESIRRNVVAKQPRFDELSKNLLKNDQQSLDQQHFLERCWGEILNH